MKLDDWRKLRNLNQTELARLLGRTESTVSRLLNNRRRPDWATMQRIVEVTDGAVTPNDFLAEQPAPAEAANG